ncbi:sugar ABC transporter substrate-binding protein [Accumulibacter sp.]|uniref:ABC transporter substrate-binding protein n=1 Tax=Accumulibacter sp. TaxID=2053492 RepID=UPI002589599F|nr:sugar ABC transporter substrate-binding protein [Accumulibacter sp.]
MLKKLLLVAVLLMVVTGVSVSAQGVTEINIWWAEWDPANYLQQIGNNYEAETGIKVNVVTTPWSSYLDRVSTEWAAQGTAYDMIVGDSQWLGQAATEGHYVDMTEFLNSNGITETVTPATLQYYGEYPAGSGTYYAYPTEGDANGWAYRKDLFEDADNMAAFEAAYGRPLAVPTTWDELRDIAEFFTRPDEGLYGVAVYTQLEGDAITMGFQNPFFSYGGDWYDETFNTLGVVNSDASVAALELYKDLYSFAPPGTNNAFFQEMNDAFVNGQAAMIMNYFAFFPALANQNINPYAESTGYFAMPAGPDGERFAALGGQGISVNNYISDERKQAAFDFITWFASEEVQQAWAALGGYTCNIAVLESPEFLEVAPYNAAFAETMTFVKDFTNIPVYGQLLEISQRYLNAYVVGGQGTAQEALDNMAAEMDEVLVEAGYISE